MKRWEDFHFFYSDHFEVELEINHRFPMNKYQALRESLLQRGIVKKSQISPANKLETHHLHLAHTPDYIEQVLSLTLDRKKYPLVPTSVYGNLSVNRQ